MKLARRAFTLIELLVVISVIALLIGITIPALSSARETSRRLKCLANLKGLGVGFEIYTHQSNGLFPIVRALHDEGGNENDPSLLEVLADFVDVPVPRRGEDGYWIVADPFQCPSDRYGALPAPSDGDAAELEPAWRTVGTSYEYLPGGFVIVAEVLSGLSPDRLMKGVTRAYENNRAWPILYDAQDWHRERAGGPHRNALLFSDYRADWNPTISGAQLEEFFAEVIRLAGGS